MAPLLRFDALQAVADSVKAQPAGPLISPLGSPVDLGVDLGNLSAPGTIASALKLIAHGVLFDTFAVDTYTPGGLPPPLTWPLGQLAPTGNPGFVGHIDIPTSVNIPITASVSWQVFKDLALTTPLDPSQFKPLNGLQSPAISLLFKPEIVALGGPVGSRVFAVPTVTMSVDSQPPPTTLTGNAKVNDQSVTVAETLGYGPTMTVTIEGTSGTPRETADIQQVTGNVLTLKSNLANAYSIGAKVGWSSGRLTASPAKTLSVPIQLPTVELPAIVGLFRWTNFQATAFGDPHGFVVVLVPSISPLSNVAFDVVSRLTALSGPLSAITSVFPELVPLATGIGMFAGAVPSQPAIYMQHTVGSPPSDGIPDLDIIQVSWPSIDPFGWFHAKAGGNTASMILLGPPGIGVHCFNDKLWLSGHNGDFTLNTASVGVAWIPDLAGKSPMSGPAGTEIQVITQPTGTRDFLHSVTGFANEIFSIKWQ